MKTKIPKKQRKWSVNIIESLIHNFVNMYFNYLFHSGKCFVHIKQMPGLAASTIGRNTYAFSGLHDLMTPCIQLAQPSTTLKIEEDNNLQ